MLGIARTEGVVRSAGHRADSTCTALPADPSRIPCSARVGLRLSGRVGLPGPRTAGVVVAAACVVADACQGSRVGARWTAFGLLACVAADVVHLVPGALGVAAAEPPCCITRRRSQRRAPCQAPATGEPGEARRRTPRAARVPLGHRRPGPARPRGACTVASAVVQRATCRPPPWTWSLPPADVARWIQEGSLWPVHDFVPDRPIGYYPTTGRVLLARRDPALRQRLPGPARRTCRIWR